MRNWITAALLLALGLTLAACGNDHAGTAASHWDGEQALHQQSAARGPIDGQGEDPQTQDTPGEDLEQAGEDLKDAAKDAGDQAKQAAEDAGDTLKQAAKDAGDAAKDMGEDAKRSAQNIGKSAEDALDNRNQEGQTAPNNAETARDQAH